MAGGGAGRHESAPIPVSIAVRVVDDRRMTTLHERFCGKPVTTDVLTFPSSGPSSGPSPGRASDSISGSGGDDEWGACDDPGAPGVAPVHECAPHVDIVVCLDEAKRQASAAGHRVEQELLLYALHGVLHCVGYDDHDERAYELMHEVEDRVLEAIGVGATFAPAGRLGTSETTTRIAADEGAGMEARS